MRKFVFLCAVFGFLIGSAFAQVPVNTSLGNVKRIINSGHGTYTFITNHGKARVIVYSPDVIRIRIDKNKFPANFSYAVVTNPLQCKIKTVNHKTIFYIETDSLVVHINKKPLRFSFLTKDGKTINADDPDYGTSWLGDKVTTYKKLFPHERFIGLGEHGGDLNRRGTFCVNYNTDNPYYNNRSESLYSTIPFYIGLHNKLAYGIFMDNPSKSLFSFGAGTNRFSYFTADCGEMNYYFIYHSSVKGIIKDYTWLTGRTPIPPIWSLGFQQCRYSYFPEADVLSTAAKFREREFPVDMIYLDIHYMNKFKDFTWDPKRFPDPKGMINKLKKMNFHLALIIDPGIKISNQYPVYKQAKDSSLFIKYPDGSNYAGQVWPGWCNFPDFTNPKTRNWWGTWVKTYADIGVTGFWNDMNEISVWGQKVPEMLNLNWDGHHTTYQFAKNAYGFQMARSTYEGAKKYMHGKRPFVLTRSGYSGFQRYSAIWTGDNHATNDQMMLGVRLINSLGLSGVAFAGMDVGGFQGTRSQDLYARWMEIGVFLPMDRAHSVFHSDLANPWDFGEVSEDIARRYVGFRYQLLPYLYSDFYEASQDGMPIDRSLSIDYTNNPLIYQKAYEQEFLFGPSILVAPAKSTQTLTKVYLPKDHWYNLFNDSIYAGKQVIIAESPLNRLPLFVKAGSIIPMQRLVESTAGNRGDTLFVHVWKGAKENQFLYYEDDGTTYQYINGDFYKRLIQYNPGKNNIFFNKKEGNYISNFKVITLVLHGFKQDNLKRVSVNGKNINIVQKKIRFFKSKFTFADYGPFDVKDVIEVSFPNDKDTISVNW